jgi:hypothetical protein
VNSPRNIRSGKLLYTVLKKYNGPITFLENSLIGGKIACVVKMPLINSFIQLLVIPDSCSVLVLLVLYLGVSGLNERIPVKNNGA